MEFTLIPLPYADLLPSLLINRMVMVSPGKVYQPPFPRWCNPNATCTYHGGVPGHSIEQCVALKHKVQSLIDAGWLTFQEDRPNVMTNPLANHGESAVNPVEEWKSRGLKQIEDVSAFQWFILEALREAGIINLDGGKGDSCLMHPGESHDVETCLIVEELLQGMMSRGQIEICNVKKGEGDVCMQSGDKNTSKPKPLVIHFTSDVTTQRPQGFQPFTVKTHAPFPYKSDKAVSWKYVVQRPDRRNGASVIRVKNDPPSAKITNISGTSGMTHSGWIFAAPELPVRSKDKRKVKANIGERDKTGSTANDKAPIGKIIEEGDDFSKKEILAEEATEFLRIIQQSECKVIEQLNKTPARISLLGLLMNSEPHRALLVKILNEAHVVQDVSVESFGGIVNNITANNCLPFADEEIPVKGRGHNKALHMSIKCLDHIVAKVLIDNSSSLKVMPKTTLDKLPFDASHIRPSSMVLRAFDRSRCDIRGEIDLPIQIGSHTCQITFQVMDINPAYSCLLGQPWIHSVGVVPSMLHQKLEFVVKGQLVIVSGEEDILVSCPCSTPYVEAAKESLEASFQALEM
ncbi:uncharacterized protein LOC114373205 [Glycine soja]|uniref:uncharacterized protein LOC114373205 n=1 Tax=Glycine soja TaxID=3848 RepID=UPI00103E534F|nr:uncharacterized protein LOC114373205 [Glycine soja]